MRNASIMVFVLGFLLFLTVGLFTVSPAFSVAWMCFVIAMTLFITDPER